MVIMCRREKCCVHSTLERQGVQLLDANRGNAYIDFVEASVRPRRVVEAVSVTTLLANVLFAL